MDPRDLYKEFDLHLSDSVSHNKFLHEDVPKLFDLNHKVGQIFCATHTGLGLCRSLNNNIHIIEQSVGISNVLDGFVVQIEFESKNGSIVGQFVDCITCLVGMELKHKPWNRSAFNKMYPMRCLYTKKMSNLGVFQWVVLCVFIPRTVYHTF